MGKKESEMRQQQLDSSEWTKEVVYTDSLTETQIEHLRNFIRKKDALKEKQEAERAQQAPKRQVTRMSTMGGFAGGDDLKGVHCIDFNQVKKAKKVNADNFPRLINSDNIKDFNPAEDTLTKSMDYHETIQQRLAEIKMETLKIEAEKQAAADAEQARNRRFPRRAITKPPANQNLRSENPEASLSNTTVDPSEVDTRPKIGDSTNITDLKKFVQIGETTAKPMRDVLRATYGVCYREPSNPKLQLQSYETKGQLYKESPLNALKMTRAELKKR